MVLYKFVKGGDCSGNLDDGQDQCLESLAKYSERFVCRGPATALCVFLPLTLSLKWHGILDQFGIFVVDMVVFFWSLIVLSNILSTDNGGQSLQERLPGSSLTCWDNSTSKRSRSLSSWSILSFFRHVCDECHNEVEVGYATFFFQILNDKPKEKE